MACLVLSWRRIGVTVSVIVCSLLVQSGCIAESDSRPAASRVIDSRAPVKGDIAERPKGTLERLDADVVTRVVDGDTVILERIGRARLIGVDTPETVDPRTPVQRFGKEASEFTRRLVGSQQVRVAYDWDRRDRYQRTLVYLYLLDGTFVNAEIIRQGYGFAYTRFPFKYMDEFVKLEREAREHARGLWVAENSGPQQPSTR
jgi:endonuclease YncB( thermonuclease family)